MKFFLPIEALTDIGGGKPEMQRLKNCTWDRMKEGNIPLHHPHLIIIGHGSESHGVMMVVTCGSNSAPPRPTC